jgi:hypothetical protein
MVKSLAIGELNRSDAGPPDASARDRALLVICFGFFLVLLDTTALNIATPALGQEFGNAISNLQWVINSYTLIFASLLLPPGQLVIGPASSDLTKSACFFSRPLPSFPPFRRRFLC